MVSQGQTGAIKGSPGTGASVVLTPRSLQAQAGLSPQLSLSYLMPAAGEEKEEERKEQRRRESSQLLIMDSQTFLTRNTKYSKSVQA